MRSITIALNISLLTLALGNCAGDPPLGPDPTEGMRVPEQLGIVLTASEVTEYSSLAWSPNGTRVFYETSPWSGSKVVDVATRDAETVDSGRTWYRHLAVSSDGRNVYFVAARDAASSGLYMASVDEERVVLLASHVPSWGLWDPPFVLSPDGAHVAYSASWPCEQTCDSLFVHNIMDDTRALYGQSEPPLIFSPDGKKIAYTFGHRIYVAETP